MHKTMSINNPCPWLFSWPFHLIVKVVDLINNAPDAVRPTVLVSATAVGYYGLHLAPTCLASCDTLLSFDTLLCCSGIVVSHPISRFNLWPPLWSTIAYLHFPFFPHHPSPPLFILSGSSETQIFDEQSPPGNDYLAEVNKFVLVSILSFILHTFHSYVCFTFSCNRVV